MRQLTPKLKYLTFFVVSVNSLFFLSVNLGCKSRNFGNAKLSSKDYQSPKLHKFKPNDVALLFPLPKSWEDYDSLLGLGWYKDNSSSEAYSFLNETHFADVLRQGYSSLSQQPDKETYLRNDKTFQLINNYKNWKVVSLRYSPCAKPNPKVENFACKAELRMVAQPVLEPKDTNTVGTTSTPSDWQTGTRFGRGLIESGSIKPLALKNYSEDSLFFTEDQAIHLIYELNIIDHRKLLQALWKFKQKSESLQLKGGEFVSDYWGKNSLERDRVWVHPMLYLAMRPSSDTIEIQSEMTAAIEELKLSLKSIARSMNSSFSSKKIENKDISIPNLKQILFLGTGVRSSGTGWAFSGFRVPENKISKAEINQSTLQRSQLNPKPTALFEEYFAEKQIEKKEAQHAQVLIHEHHLFSNAMSTPFQQPTLPDDIISLSDRLGVKPESRQDFLKKSINFFNPTEHGQSERNCGNCHTSTSAFLLAFRNKLKEIPQEFEKQIGKDALLKLFGEESTWLGNASQGFYPLFYAFNLRQFGYYLRYPAVSIRTQMEAAADSEYLVKNSQKLSNALNFN